MHGYSNLKCTIYQYLKHRVTRQNCGSGDNGLSSHLVDCDTLHATFKSLPILSIGVWCFHRSEWTGFVNAPLDVKNFDLFTRYIHFFTITTHFQKVLCVLLVMYCHPWIRILFVAAEYIRLERICEVFFQNGWRTDAVTYSSIWAPVRGTLPWWTGESPLPSPRRRVQWTRASSLPHGQTRGGHPAPSSHPAVVGRRHQLDSRFHVNSN